MGIASDLKANILAQSLPYIQKYHGKIIVIKYGGNAMINDELKEAVMGDIVLLNLIGIKVVLVHGGGPKIDEMLKKINKKSEFIDGLRVTDKETMDIVQMVLAGEVNKSLVQMINKKGGVALGLCGIDDEMIIAKKLDDVHGFVGEITEINTKIIFDALNDGCIPVISTLACDREGNTYNVNADTAASKIASALKAESLISMTDVIGLLRNIDDSSSLISSVSVGEVKELIDAGIISGGMIPKVECCVDAIKNGVNKSVIIDGRVPHSILIEMLTNDDIGTIFKK